MRRAVSVLLALHLLAAGVLAAGPGRAAQSTSEGNENDPMVGLPANVPLAARQSEPPLPRLDDHVWPFPDAFPRTSGTSVLAAGAFEYSDFLYDDHGAKGVPRSTPVAGLAPSVGTYEYSAPEAKLNGADIFRVGIGLKDGATYWRVDWTTLFKDHTDIPIAEFAIDTDSNSQTGVSAWPAGAGVTSPGIDKALVVSAKKAVLLDTSGAGGPAQELPVTVDKDARSFVVRVPKGALPVTGTSIVRVASGQANAAGDGFAPVDPQHGALPGQPAVFNVGFRRIDQEAPASNYWMESAQANALAAGDVRAFKADVDWSQLRDDVRTAEPQPTGYSNRWYVSSLGWANDAEQGVIRDSGNSTGDLRPNFLGRVQPYAVLVPTGYTRNEAKPTKLTWVLHSLSEQHNQYGSLNMQFLQGACEKRASICATTLGRGPDGWYFDEAELDFWEVWNRLANTYSLDPEHTVVSGYSMGGWATYKLGLSHPDLFAKAVVLAGPPLCGLRAAQGIGGAAGPGRCTSDGDSSPLIENARSLPYYIAHGTSDELVPVTGVVQQVKFFDDLGYRYLFELYPGQDHMAWAAEGMWPSAVAKMNEDGNQGKGIDHHPQHVTYRWYPFLDAFGHGIGATGAYWIREPQAVDTKPGSNARIDAWANALESPASTPYRQQGVVVPGQPTPGVSQELTWIGSPTPKGAVPAVVLNLTNVASATVDLTRAGAGFEPGTTVVVTVHTAAEAYITFRTSHPDKPRPVVEGTYAIVT